GTRVISRFRHGRYVRRSRKGFCGGGKRDRTADLLHAMQALSQLSYTPTSKPASIDTRIELVKGRASAAMQAHARLLRFLPAPPSDGPARCPHRSLTAPAWRARSGSNARFARRPLPKRVTSRALP